MLIAKCQRGPVTPVYDAEGLLCWAVNAAQDSLSDISHTYRQLWGVTRSWQDSCRSNDSRSEDAVQELPFKLQQRQSHSYEHNSYIGYREVACRRRFTPTIMNPDVD